SAVGSLREDLAPGDFVVIDQFVDRTFARDKSFFGAGCVAHVSMARPVCGRIGDAVVEAGAASGIALKRGGAYIVMEGPQFSTLAESELYRTWGCDVIGMTNMPEAKLAREAEICYATVAMVTDYDCWHPGHDDVTVDMIDQTRLPHELAIVRLGHVQDAARAIRDMQVRGAPLIGATAAYGVALAMIDDPSDKGLDGAVATLAATRPTAVNLRWALAEMRDHLGDLPPEQRFAAAIARAGAIAEEDVAINRAIGEHGLRLIEAAHRRK